MFHCLITQRSIMQHTQALFFAAAILFLNPQPAGAAESSADKQRRLIAVLESGVGSRADVEAGVACGASAILIGEALMRSGDPRVAAASFSAPVDADEGGDGSA